ncbi:MAG: 2-phosphosulfolactate phosphatase [Planctomycetes bacterium]|nr:2-phosphosulfolactate phosphatase [Planctomycetota bacterium]
MAPTGSRHAPLGTSVGLDWGHDGAARAAGRGDVLVVVDVLSFSSVAATAVHRGVELLPCGWDEDPVELAARHAAQTAVHRRDVPSRGRYSLSPLTFLDAPRGARVVLRSPNGATCVRHAGSVPELLVGSLLNARATAWAASDAAERTCRPITVLACGERWAAPGSDGPLRFAVEDLLGAGAVLTGLEDRGLSPDAAAAVAAFRDAAPAMEQHLLRCESGCELVAAGYREDVRHAAQLDLYEEAVALVERRLVAQPVRDGQV